ncbi:MAG: 3-hydroxyanthranilate 3,4-dioxygenase [Bdellovibrionales bacterium]|nr:3-hydroxyanthranilate 3,4-dioxygenase [Bdellovibrionales bacterium]
MGGEKKLVSPIGIKQWISKYRDQLKPPVGNKELWKDQDFIVMMVAGPNTRKDFHIDPGPELFYQIEGDITLRIKTEKGFDDISIKEGEVYLLPSLIPHLPIRPAGTMGMVVEKKRLPEEIDHIVWFCESCGHELFKKEFLLKDIVAQLEKIILSFYSDVEKRTCNNCQSVFSPPKNSQ